MTFINFSRTALTASVLVVCFSAAPLNAMLPRYVAKSLATLAGDGLFLMSVHSIAITQENLASEYKTELKKAGLKHKELDQSEKDAKKVARYAPVLIPVGGVASIAGRFSMAKGSWLFAILSLPLNFGLLASGYYARLVQAPDASLVATAQDMVNDTAQKVSEKLTGGKKE